MLTLTLTTETAARVLTTLQNNLSNLLPLMEQARDVLTTSVRENFVQGGRPTPWTPLRPPRTGIPLVGARGLLNSITAEVTSTSVTLQSDLPYSAAQQYGGSWMIPEVRPVNATVLRFVTAAGEVIFTRRVRAHTVTIPARPYLIAQAEDEQTLVALAESHLAQGI